MTSKITLLIVLLVSAFAVHPSASAQQWPAFRNDNARSGYVNSELSVARLEPAWQWKSDVPPDPAWDGPARWDAYNLIRDLPAMRQYDACFHPVSDGESVFFGSSSQDTLTACCSVATTATPIV